MVARDVVSVEDEVQSLSLVPLDLDILCSIFIDNAKFLLSPRYFKENRLPDSDPMTGHCYVATEVAYHLIGKHEGYCPKVVRHKDQDWTHWFLHHKQSNHIIDITSSQFSSVELDWCYANARYIGLLTRFPSKRAQFVIDLYHKMAS